jgi:peroxiredoxin
MPALEIGSTAPSFTLQDLDEKARSLKDLPDGALMLLVFYHSGCPTCQLSMPFIGNLARAVKSAGVVVWGVSQDEEDESQRFAQVKGLQMPVLIDPEPYKVSQAFGLTNVPTLFLIDSRRRIIDQCVGFAKVDFSRIADTVAGHAGVAPPDIYGGQQVPAMAYG